jgi:hypothetical protein
MISAGRIEALAARAGIDDETRRALAQVVAIADASKTLARDTEEALETLRTSPSGAAIERIASLPSARELGERAPVWHLLLALLEIPDGDVRHAQNGVDPQITDATWRDLGLWCAHFRERYAVLGITLEILDWAQYYLRGELYRVGAVQWELRAFGGSARGFSHRRTREVRWLASPGVWLSCGGRRYSALAEPGAREARGTLTADAVEGHPIDTQRGAADLERVECLNLRDEWDVLVAPDTMLLEMHIPADAGLELRAFVASARSASALFARLRPGVKARGVFGEAWLLDPQVRELLPNHVGIAAFQGASALLPGKIPEAKTVRRLFGPNATRASAVVAPREGMTSLQRAAAKFLEDPSHVLCAARGVLLDDGLDALERAVSGG